MSKDLESVIVKMGRSRFRVDEKGNVFRLSKGKEIKVVHNKEVEPILNRARKAFADENSAALRERDAKAKAEAKAKAKPLSKRAAILAAAEAGALPPPPDFSAATHARWRGKLAELVALANAGDAAGLAAYEIKAHSTSPNALARYRHLCVIAIKARKK